MFVCFQWLSSLANFTFLKQKWTCETTPGSPSLPAAAKWRAAQSPAAPPPTTATRNTIAANSEDIATVYGSCLLGSN